MLYLLKEYKEKIYTELTQLVREDRIDVYDISNGKYIDAGGQEQHLNEIQEAKTQFLFLQKKWKAMIKKLTAIRFLEVYEALRDVDGGNVGQF